MAKINFLLISYNTGLYISSPTRRNWLSDKKTLGERYGNIYQNNNKPMNNNQYQILSFEWNEIHPYFMYMFCITSAVQMHAGSVFHQRWFSVWTEEYYVASFFQIYLLSWQQDRARFNTTWILSWTRWLLLLVETEAWELPARLFRSRMPLKEPRMKSHPQRWL